ncbi:MAG: serine protease [Candidatus Pacebacteria bacterium]|nr:serine protease [Candidatus Paceibacterota bacterium]
MYISRVLAGLLFVGVLAGAPLISWAKIDSNLQFGSKGAQVVELQKFLIEKGYLNGQATGNYFGLTRQAVIAFQRASGISQTGFVGPLTRAKINSLLTESPVQSSQSTTTPQVAAQTPPLSLLGIPFYMIKNTWTFSGLESFQKMSDKRPPIEHFIDSSQVPDLAVNPETVVLVRCKFVGSYTYATDQKPTPMHSIGSGVIVSPEGHILTAAHIIRDQEINLINKENQNTNIVWKRDSCEVARTDSALTPIDSGAYANWKNPAFLPATIVFLPTDAEYNAGKFEDPDRPGKMLYFDYGADLDFALLQVSGSNLPYAPLVEKLVLPKLGDKMIGLGYPGLAVGTTLSLERIDTTFSGFSWLESSSCNTKSVLQSCGLNYQSRRYKEDFKALYEKQTSLGKHTSYFRGGFSGGPLFYKGHVIGVLLTSMENPYSNLYDLTHGQWNWVDARATSEIIPALKQAGITLPTVK